MTTKAITSRYGSEGDEVTIENFQELNPDGEFKELWDGSIMEIFSDKPGDWEIIAKPDNQE